ncbi:MAG: 2-amino-4-hydroxy-6-hydroxymethyldihydropteridine diphosphokinase [Bacteroides sp.]|nr:2-amino-4-hydroxy-6-hydroxymethyldihydropteridine diphosphokinase [Bacteroides sp.]MCM1457025.1 2-amino-4-hydroxy-6-hydroxymethyldihydropteridine diphosphokinase [Lachnoclostridium sp.]
MYTYFILLGSNTENATENIRRALMSFVFIGDIAGVSPVEKSDNGYYNCVVVVRTSLDADALTEQTKATEKMLGRDADDREHIPIDIDIVMRDTDILRPREASAPYFISCMESLM